jgi:hypothetical protein
MIRFEFDIPTPPTALLAPLRSILRMRNGSSRSIIRLGVIAPILVAKQLVVEPGGGAEKGLRLLPVIV